jgi:phosphoglycolate phosphatase-like HAD superfamily hydrolase
MQRSPACRALTYVSDAMKTPSQLTALLFDFDGVIVESEVIRIDGFRAIFSHEPPALVERLIEYHVANGGLSRYAKIRWFYETQKRQVCPDDELAGLAQRFKTIMLERMKAPGLVIPKTLDLIRAVHGRVPMHICSGSDGGELREICKAHGIDSYFETIEGSPTPKDELVRNLMAKFGYDAAHTIFIGDAINDLTAAKANGLWFYGINNENLRAISDAYLDDFIGFQRSIDRLISPGRATVQ